MSDEGSGGQRRLAPGTELSLAEWKEQSRQIASARSQALLARGVQAPRDNLPLRAAYAGSVTILAPEDSLMA